MSYILLRCRTGLNDCLYELWTCTKYAIEHKRSIIIQFIMYNSTDLTTIFDFSNYPIKIITDTTILNNFINKDIYPSIYKPQLLNPKDVKQISKHSDFLLNGIRIDFDRSTTYPINTLLISDGMGRSNSCFKHLEYIEFNKNIKDKLKFIQADMPNTYNAIHIRATDKIFNNTPIIKKFIKKSDMSVFISSDDSTILNNIEKTYGSKIIKTTTIFYNTNSNNLLNYQVNNLHQFGMKHSNVLSEAILDLLILASANKLLIANKRSGYSRLANYLFNNKTILRKLID